MQPDGGGGGIEVGDGRLREAIVFRAGSFRVRNGRDVLARVNAAAIEQSHFVAHLGAVRLAGNAVRPPVNRIIGTVMGHKMRSHNLRGAFADPKRALGIGAVSRVINKAGVHLAVITHFDIKRDGLIIRGDIRHALRYRILGQDRRVGRRGIMINPRSRFVVNRRAVT